MRMFSIDFKNFKFSSFFHFGGIAEIPKKYFRGFGNSPKMGKGRKFEFYKSIENILMVILSPHWGVLGEKWRYIQARRQGVVSRKKPGASNKVKQKCNKNENRGAAFSVQIGHHFLVYLNFNWSVTWCYIWLKGKLYKKINFALINVKSESDKCVFFWNKVLHLSWNDFTSIVNKCVLQ